MRQSTLDTIVGLLVRGATAAEIADAALAAGVPRDDIGLYVLESRRTLAQFAAYSRDEQVGLSLARLHDCYARSIAMQDVRAAIAAQRQINLLLGLIGTESSAGDAAAEESPEIAEAREYLAGVVPGAATLSLTDLCRIAAQKIATGA